ncbi:hypothetical protein [Dactylosporangium sp. CA-092794]|uniref:hypothetical protein n=1 Tax=Dactylosporangium sp. CA-092794 TaxID=3239929 RepID=UPI003D9381C4
MSRGAAVARRHRMLVGAFRPQPAAGRWLGVLLAPSDPAGLLLLVLPVLPALALTGWLLTAVPLAVLGAFHWWTVLPAAVLAAGLLIRWALPRLLVLPARPAPWWALGAVVAVAAGFAVLAVLTHSQQAVLHRDAGTYAQIGLWLSGHPGLTSPVPADAYGSASDMVVYHHPGFYVQNGRIVPQFMTGWPTLLAAGFWAAGWHGAFALPGLVGGAAVLAVGGLAARLTGPRWAPFAALLLALAWPMLRVSQTTYSEPLACLMLAGGLCLLADGWTTGAPTSARRATGARQRNTGVLLGLAGLVLSAGELVRLDMGVDFALVLPAIGWWWLHRRPGLGWFLLGTAVGGSLGYLDCRYVTRPYVDVNWSSARLMIVLLAAVAAGTTGGALLLRRRPLRLSPARRRLIAAAAVAAITVAGVALAARPLLYVDHSITAPATIDYVQTHQQALGLPLDGTRGYTEHSLSWVSWYLGWPALLLAWTGIMLAAAGAARGRDWRLLPILLVYAGSGAATLLRPAITPDHPWADRRLVVEVLPAIALFATLAIARATRAWLGRPAARAVRLPWPALRVLPPLLLTAAAVLPAVPVYAQLAPLRTELGEPQATAAVCRALQPNDSVILMDTWWEPTIRNQCGIPVATLLDPTVPRIQTVVAAVRATGRDPVLLASTTIFLLPYGLPPQQVVNHWEQEDQHQLLQRPKGTTWENLQCWLVRA